MKKFFIAVLLAVVFLGLSSCGTPAANQKSDAASSNSEQSQSSNEHQEDLNRKEDNSSLEAGAVSDMQIHVNGQTFQATFAETEAAHAFAKLLPLTISMQDVNGNEKYALLDSTLAQGNERPEQMNSGEIMCYQGNGLVLFYETFNNSYGGYSRIAQVEEAEELAAVLGKGTVTILFSMSDDPSL